MDSKLSKNLDSAVISVLRRVDFPAKKSEVIARAKEERVPYDVLLTLNLISERSYKTIDELYAEVWHSAENPNSQARAEMDAQNLSRSAQGERDASLQKDTDASIGAEFLDIPLSQAPGRANIERGL